MALGRADEEAGEEDPRPPPQRAPRPPSLLSFLRGGSAGRRRWRRRERYDGGPSGAEQRMWLMGSDEEDEDEDEGRAAESLFPVEMETPRRQIPATPPEGPVAVIDDVEGGAERGEDGSAAGESPDSGDPVRGWSVLLRKKGEEGEGAGGESGSRCRKRAKMVGAGLSGPWAFGVFAVTGQVAGEVSGPCAVASLVLAALAAIVAALCHAELEDAAETTRPGPRDYTTAPAPSSSSSASSHSDSPHSEEEEHRGAAATSAAPPPRRRLPATKRSLLCGWISVLGHAAAVAAACRALSASMDYITGGRVRRASEERFGALPAVLGASSPDVLAVGVAALPTLLFVLGLEPWSGLRTMLNAVVVVSVLFFVGAGSLETDPGNWAHGFLPAGFSGLVSGSAMSTLGFVGLHAVVAEGRRERALASGVGSLGRKQPSQRSASNSSAVAAASTASLLIAFTSYFAVATVLTMMVQFRSLSAGTPLVQAFEVRDVDWARLVMASLGIAALALALVEASPPLHRATVALSAPDGLLPRRLAREHPKTATPAFAILGSGLLASALALVGDPLALLRLSSAAPLLAHALSAVDLIHRRYQPIHREDCPSDRSGGKNNRRTQQNLPREDHTKRSVKTIKDGLAFLKRDTASEQVVYESLPTTEPRANGSAHPPAEGSAVDEEPLLSSAQDSDPIEAGCMASSSEDGGGEGAEGSGLSGYESDSNTDIDAIVAEYKERLKVATLDGGGGGTNDSTASQTQPEPSAATGRRVSMAVSGLLVCSLAVGLASLLLASGAGASAVALATASSFVAFLLLALVARQPQRTREERVGSFRVPLVPWLPGVSLTLHVGLLLQVLVNAWIPFVLWALIGFSLYYWKRGSKGRSSASDAHAPSASGGWSHRSGRGRHHPHRRPKEQVRLRPPPKHSVVSSLIPSHRRAPDESIRRLTQVDTILISR